MAFGFPDIVACLINKYLHCRQREIPTVNRVERMRVEGDLWDHVEFVKTMGRGRICIEVGKRGEICIYYEGGKL